MRFVAQLLRFCVLQSNMTNYAPRQMSNMLKTATQYKKNHLTFKLFIQSCYKKARAAKLYSHFYFLSSFSGMQIDCLSKMNNSDYRTAGNNCGGLEPQAVPLSCILLPSQSSHLHLCNETLGFFSMKANFYMSEHTRPPHNGSAFCSLWINWCLLNKVVSSAVGEL